MGEDDRDILEVLRFELEFLEKGGYGRSPRTPWREQFIFEDSPTCMNYDNKERLVPCEQCALMQFVPTEHSKEVVPCRFIPLNARGETVDSLYRWGTYFEIQETLAGWLRATIRQIEQKRDVDRGTEMSPPVKTLPASATR